MKITLTNRTDVSILLDRNGISVYVGDNQEPSETFDIAILADDFLDHFCDENGHIYESRRSDLDSILKQMNNCILLLESAKKYY